MTQSLYLYWRRLTQRTGDQRIGAIERLEAPVLDLAGCFGSPAIRAPRPEAIVARLADAAPTRLAAR